MYGLTITNQNYINEKAKTKKDGCYQARGVAYRVVAGMVTHFACNGEVLQQYGHFNTVVGTFDGCGSDRALKFLKGIKQ